ncbi:hypothetical protein BHE97_07245 [Aeromicrobium sp. PE09-221]|uniref:hypothetical protein n=1 Tax=Aeromicrobium sp. PE09-221 TaxID=1898043 RepID=UPI000B6F1B30|nr:hypothetical protein [Aeromicrobium sp. PE09-221]OUZ10544.1 hypothetical protein BHE97_07245 [Aeromicrobium sp. PE09-221]
MITLNEAQVWAMIVGTIAVFFTLAGLITSWFTRLLKAEMASLHARFEGIDHRFEGIDQQFESFRAEVSAKLETTNTKLTHLDRDVQALTKRVFHRPE